MNGEAQKYETLSLDIATKFMELRVAMQARRDFLRAHPALDGVTAPALPREFLTATAPDSAECAWAASMLDMAPIEPDAGWITAV